MATYLGQFALESEQLPEAAIGVFETFEGEWFARVWRDSFGPCQCREDAELLLMMQLNRYPAPYEDELGLIRGMATIFRWGSCAAAAAVICWLFFL